MLRKPLRNLRSKIDPVVGLGFGFGVVLVAAAGLIPFDTGGAQLAKTLIIAYSGVGMIISFSVSLENHPQFVSRCHKFLKKSFWKRS